jgi:GTP cyclohydrolase II/3,4-dihydroxy 2-butanone 4-phosphate synthase/GTP cyclohydrolase II
MLMRDAGQSTVNGHAALGAKGSRSYAPASWAEPNVTDAVGRGAGHGNEPMFLETAHTMLPVEFQGREVMLEAHAYEDDSVSYQAMAVVHRVKNGADPIPLVRMHSGCVTGDIFHSLRCDCYQQLQKAMERIIDSHFGVIIYLPFHEGRGIGLVKKLQAYAEQDRGLDTVDANLSVGAPVEARDYGLAAKILQDLGIDEVRLMTNNPLKVEALKQLGIKVAEQVPHVVEASPYNKRYLETKKQRMAHKL